MILRYKTVFIIGLTYLVFASCNHSEKNDADTDNAVENMAEESTQVRQLNCPSITRYPVLFSYKTEELRQDILSKGKTDLNTAEKETYFPKNDETKIIFDDACQVFPLNKMTYANSAVVIYLAKKIKGTNPYSDDRIFLVMYNRESKPVSSFNISLKDALKTKELNLESLIRFEVINTNTENGSQNEPLITRSIYQIDTVQLQFKPIK